MANYDVGDALSRIENILLDSIGRNMKRHLKEESDLQKSWSMWQTEQLTSLNHWSAKNYKQFAPQFTSINNQAMQMLRQANQNGELNQEIKILQTGIQDAQRFFDVPNDKLDSLLKAVRSDLSRAEHSILRKADDVYREALFNSHFYLQSGSGTLNSAIDMAVEDLHQRGLHSVVYRNGAHVSASVYARMALRSANERAQLLGEGKARDKFGIHTVIVPPSGIACPKCAPWLCRVLVDDVYSAGTPAEAADLNLPLLSEAIRQGFLHPQCNCSPQTYFPDSPVPEMSDSQREEAVRKYQITQKQRYHERQIRKWKQAEKSAPDDAAKKAASARKREWQKRNKDLCDKHSDFLRRDYFREKIYDSQTPPITPNVIDKPTPPEPAPKLTQTKPAVISENSVLQEAPISLEEARRASENAALEAEKSMKNNLTETTKNVTINMGRFSDYYGQEHTQVIRDCLSKSPEPVQKIWNRYAPYLNSIDVEYRKNSHYDSEARGVRLHIAQSASGNDIMAPYETVFHEYGHHIDYLMNLRYGNKDPMTAYSEVYENGLLGGTIKKEAEKVLKDFGDSLVASGMYATVPERKELEELFCNTINSEFPGYDKTAIANVSDMFESVMLFTVNPFGAGHKAKNPQYWENEGNRSKEAFAEMFSATISNSASLEQIKKYFPEAYAVFLEILEAVT